MLSAVVLISVFCIGLYLWLGSVLFLNSSKIAARNEICRAYSLVAKGDGYVDAVSRITKGGWKYIYIVGENENIFVISAPVEFPGLTTQWRMFVIGKDGVIDGVDLKTVDGGDVYCDPKNG